MIKLKHATVVLLLGLVMSGCAGHNSFRTAENQAPVNIKRLLLMPVDVELSLLTAGGIKEPNAQWTTNARRHIANSVRQIVKEHNARVVNYGSSHVQRKHVQIVKLHGAVGGAILIHKYVQGNALPTKAGKFDWTLGKSVNRLRKQYNADHALFIFMRDSYASSGRKAAVFVGSLIGANVRGGSQTGFASLVNLRTGHVVWFNLLARGNGDLRTAEAARETVGSLLAGIPK